MSTIVDKSLEIKTDNGLPVTQGEFYRHMADINTRLDKIIANNHRFISRFDAERTIGRKHLQNAINIGMIKPIRRVGKNTKMLIERSELDAYIEFMKQ